MTRNEIETTAAELTAEGFLKNGQLRRYEAGIRLNSMATCESIVWETLTTRYMKQNNVRYDVASLAVRNIQLPGYPTVK